MFPAYRPCAACGESTTASDLRDVHGDVAALLDVPSAALVCRWCEGRAERELDAAEEALALASDPDFVTVCDARRDGWIAALESETAAQWAAVVRVGGDVLDAEVAL
jgi:hypothetical protein